MSNIIDSRSFNGGYLTVIIFKKTVTDTGTVFQRSLPHIASDWWDYVSSQACHIRAHLKTHSGEKLNKCNQQCYEGSSACCHRPLTQFAWERDAKNPLKAFFAFSTGNHGSVPSWLVFWTWWKTCHCAFSGIPHLLSSPCNGEILLQGFFAALCMFYTESGGIKDYINLSLCYIWRNPHL